MSQPAEPDRERAEAAAGWYRLNRRQQHFWDGADWTGERRRTPRVDVERRPGPKPWVEAVAVLLALVVLAGLAYLVVVVV